MKRDSWAFSLCISLFLRTKLWVLNTKFPLSALSLTRIEQELMVGGRGLRGLRKSRQQ